MQRDIPSNLYRPNAPLTCKVLENRRLTADDSPNQVQHIVLDRSGGDFPYIEGQSLGIVPPGIDANGRPHKLRLYSIASPSYGDDGDSKTVSLCVKRAVTVLPETGERFEGVCSSYLCDLNVGDEVQVTGPVGKAFVMPQAADTNLIMIATGTGIAPFRAFMHRRYTQQESKATSWLFFGAQTRKDFLYEDELMAYQQHHTFRLSTAFSREEQTLDGRRMYVQHRIFEQATELLELVKLPSTYLFMCGLRGMEGGVLEGLQHAAAATQTNWDELFETLKKEHRWHVEVY